jgi:capsid assembly protease
MNLFSLACSVPWAITEDGLRTVLQIAGREELDPELARQIREAREDRPSAVAARGGKPLDGARKVSVRDGTALIPITGPIVRRADFFSDVSGGAAIATLASDFHAALNDGSVKAILFVVDSPGGEVSGVSEFANMVFAARGQKPLTAYVEGLGCSAAYWIASACDEIVLDDTAMVGSIGVVTAVPDPSKQTARSIEIVSSQSPNKRPDVSTERGRQQIQDRVDALADVFVATVARNRGVSVETVLDDFGQGGVFVGQHAVAAGLADRIGSFEGTLATLITRVTPKPMQARPYHFGAQEEPMDFKAFFKGMFAAAAEVEAEQAPATPAASEEPAAPAVASDAAATAELSLLRTELEQRKAAEAQAVADQRAQAAEAFAEAQIAASRAVPADHDALIAVYTAAAAAGTTAQLEALFAERPAHQITQEVLPASETQALAADPTAAGAAKAEAKARLMAQTSLGQAALARRKA